MMIWKRCDDGKWLWIYDISCLDKKIGTIITTFIKKKARWPKHTEALEAIDEVQGQYVWTIRSCKGNVSAENENNYMV